MLKIAHLYPDLLDLYGDRGNILTLIARCRWRGLEVAVEQISIGDQLDFNQTDILFLGGGSDREQGLLVADLMNRRDDLRQAIEDGLAVLTICGGYQFLGEYYQTAEGKKIPGLELFNLWTTAGSERMIGNIALNLVLPDLYSAAEKKTLVGFENHAGKTFLGPELSPLGYVISGYGNNGQDQSEGLSYKNLIGTYLHGPLLPKNPHLADWLLSRALIRQGKPGQLEPLDDKLEMLAHQEMLNRLMRQ